MKAVVETMLPDFASKLEIFAGDVVDKKKPDPVGLRRALNRLEST